jgi:membrane protein implicated in regulation of membrane protease activity
MTYLLGLLVLVLAVAAGILLTWWGGLVVLIAGVLFLVYLASARKSDPSVGTIERGRRTEPTGQVRSGSAGVETSNQRQGQE